MAPTSLSPPSPAVLATRLRAAARPADPTRPAGAGPLVLVHGFTQTSRCWGPVDDELVADHDLVLVDAPGHGRSSTAVLDLVAGGRALAEAGGPGTYIGYSMGARLCLHAALDQPERVERLVLISGTGGLDQAGDRAERRRSDQALADHVEAVGVAAFVDEWLRRPMFAGLPPERAHRVERLTNTSAGLASSLRAAGTGTQQPLWPRLGRMAMPVLVVAGAEDRKFVALAERLAATIGGDAELAVVARAGHTVHLEQPEAFLTRLRDWLTRTTP